MTTQIKILNVNINNKYKGNYEKIFSIINEDRLFLEIYELDDSIGLIGNTYFLKLSEKLESNQIDKILKLKNIEILS